MPQLNTPTLSHKAFPSLITPHHSFAVHAPVDKSRGYATLTWEPPAFVMSAPAQCTPRDHHNTPPKSPHSTACATQYSRGFRVRTLVCAVRKLCSVACSARVCKGLSSRCSWMHTPQVIYAAVCVCALVFARIRQSEDPFAQGGVGWY